MTDPTTRTTSWMDDLWDADTALLWNPPGSFDDVTGPRTVHLVRESAWYALGLLRRDEPGDRDRAERTLTSVLDHQYDEPSQPWHGTFVRFPEWPAPQEGAVEWVDYDPNWRQFLGTALAVAVTDFALDPALVARARAAIDLAVTAEPPDRVPPTYANIALLRAWLEAWNGSTDPSYAAAIADAFGRHGCFTEHNSPTYYGVDLLALGLWQRSDARADLQALGRRIEAALWTDIARWYHPGLGNLCGPYSRAYGMDLHAYVSGLGLALWCAGLPGPLPDLSAPVVPHGHDLCMTPVLQHVGLRVPDDVRPRLAELVGPHAVDQLVDADPPRRASGWLGRDLMVGAESGASGLHARGQFHPATVHWRLPHGGVGWLRLVHHGPTSAVARERGLDVECRPHPRHGPCAHHWESNVDALQATQDHWSLPGLEVTVATDAALTGTGPLTYGPAPSGTTHTSLTF
jgi:hypothetical protein